MEFLMQKTLFRQCARMQRVQPFHTVFLHAILLFAEIIWELFHAWSIKQIILLELDLPLHLLIYIYLCFKYMHELTGYFSCVIIRVKSVLSVHVPSTSTDNTRQAGWATHRERGLGVTVLFQAIGTQGDAPKHAKEHSDKNYNDDNSSSNKTIAPATKTLVLGCTSKLPRNTTLIYSSMTRLGMQGSTPC